MILPKWRNAAVSLPSRLWYLPDHIPDSASVIESEDTLDLEKATSFEHEETDPRNGAACLEKYSLVVDDSHWNFGKNNNNILIPSKQISEEALNALYGDNIFKLHFNGEGECYFRKNFTEANRQRMRFLLLVAQPCGVSYELGRMPDDASWSSMLPHLRVLRLVADHPLEAGGYYNAPTLEQDIDRWVEWIRPFLECFG